MSDYIDGFLFPIRSADVDTYQRIAQTVATIWKEHGALDYREYLGDAMHLAGTRAFSDAVDAGSDESVVFGWVRFPSRAARDQAHQAVSTDPRMAALIAPLVHGDAPIFNAERMAYGGFRALVHLP